MAKSIEELSLNDQLPDSIKQDSQIRSTVYAVDPWLKLCAFARGLPSVLYNVDLWPGDILDHIATEFNFTAWDSTWPVERKRRILKAYLIAYKMRTGTVYAVEQAIESFGPGVSFTEWWQKEPKGIPHTFEVHAMNDDGSSLNMAEQESLKSLIDATKPARSHYTMTIGWRHRAFIRVWSGFLNLLTYQFEGYRDRYVEPPIEVQAAIKIGARSLNVLTYLFESAVTKEKPFEPSSSFKVAAASQNVLTYKFEAYRDRYKEPTIESLSGLSVRAIAQNVLVYSFESAMVKENPREISGSYLFGSTMRPVLVFSFITPK